LYPPTNMCAWIYRFFLWNFRYLFRKLLNLWNFQKLFRDFFGISIICFAISIFFSEFLVFLLNFRNLFQIYFWIWKVCFWLFYNFSINLFSISGFFWENNYKRIFVHFFKSYFNIFVKSSVFPFHKTFEL